jgi:hypothetical protein
MRFKTTSMTTCLCVVALSTLRGQTDRAPWQSGELGIFASVVQSEQLNATASPLTFRGRGYDAAADYRDALDGGRFMLALSADGGVRQVASNESAASATERVTQASLTGALLRQFARDSSARSFGAGIAMDVDFSMTAHRYADPTRRVADFLAAFMTLGPAASWRERIGGGSALLQVTMPMIALADHPYSDTRSDYSPTDIRVTGLRTLRGINGALTYMPGERRHVGIGYAYRFSLLDYADVQPLRSASQSFAIGIVTRFGRGAR